MINTPIKFTISCANDKIWNICELINFLATNQNKYIKLKINPEAICLTTIGLYSIIDSFKFLKVDIYTENLLESHEIYNIIHPDLGKWAKQWITHVPNIDPSLHCWNFKKIFLNFYRRPTANRIGIAGHLLANYKNISKIHFTWGNSLDELALYEFDKLARYSIKSVKNAVDLAQHMPLQEYKNINLFNVGGPSIPDGKKFAFNYQYDDDKGINMYNDILVDIVSESHVSGNTFYITEKTVRPMWLKKSFIVFASKNYLDYLHQMGFKTFNDFWSEEYDGYEDRDRYVKILELIDTLAKKPIKELQQMYIDMQEIFEHNYNLLLNQNYNTNITYIE